jgi:hypothetical protein
LAEEAIQAVALKMNQNMNSAYFMDEEERRTMTTTTLCRLLSRSIKIDSVGAA